MQTEAIEQKLTIEQNFTPQSQQDVVARRPGASYEGTLWDTTE